MFTLICVLGVVAWMVNNASTPYLIHSETNLVYMDDNQNPPPVRMTRVLCGHRVLRDYERIERTEPKSRIYRGAACAHCAKILAEREMVKWSSQSP